MDSSTGSSEFATISVANLYRVKMNSDDQLLNNNEKGRRGGISPYELIHSVEDQKGESGRSKIAK
jgi:hypothetical protein